MKAAHHDTPASAPSQHPDPYLIDAERAARRAHNGEGRPSIPACNVSPAGIRIVAAIDVPIGARINNVRNQPVTFIGAGEHHALVRFDDGEIDAVELGELTNAFMSDDDAFNDRLPVRTIDTLAHLAGLLAELQQLDPADPDDGIDEQTIEDARDLRERIGRRVAEVCGEAFHAEDPDAVGQGR